MKKHKKEKKKKKKKKKNAGQGKWGVSGHFNADTCTLPHFRSFSGESMEPVCNSRVWRTGQR
ncbi:hypothetical protein CGRA01v4_09038 [Colletotrichum graminicola]|nr:hypothetical protein CGRA01v4_09038 [Colletotrichum graminicola]